MASFRVKNNGLWEYRISVKKVQPDGTVKYVQKAKGGFKTKKAAERAAYEHQELLLGTTIGEDLKIKDFLDEWYTDYVDVKTNDYARNTLLSYRTSIERLKEGIGHIRVSDLTPASYQKYINGLLNRYAVGTVINTHGTLRAAYKQAVINNEIKYDPTAYIKIKKNVNRRVEKKVKYLEFEYIEPLLTALYDKGIHYGIFFEFLLESGVRMSEARAIKLDDIDWQAKTIRIDESYDDIKGAPGPTKNTSSMRTLKMRDEFMEKLRAYVKLNMQDRPFLNGMTEGFVFPLEKRATWHYQIKKALKKIGHDGKLSVHSLRHTHAVLLLEAGASMKDVQERLGHSSMTTTADTYAHVTQKMRERTVELFDEYMKSAEK